MKFWLVRFACLLVCSCSAFSNVATSGELGDKIAKYANSFVGTPYDRIPIGLYVQSRKLIIDDEIDCMYLVFRSVPLALADGDNKKASDIACNKMFHDKCKLDKDGLVTNYENRFDYSEDMIFSGKWGKSIYAENEMSVMAGSRHYKRFYYVKSQDFINSKKLQQRVQNGDILFLYKFSEKRSKLNEAIGHLGIIEVKNGEIYLIHASGRKGHDVPQGKVVKVKLTSYLAAKKEKWAGIYLTRISS